jgi:hypothetical protein
MGRIIVQAESEFQKRDVNSGESFRALRSRRRLYRNLRRGGTRGEFLTEPGSGGIFGVSGKRRRLGG